MKTCHYLLVLALSITLLGCNRAQSRTENNDNQLLFATEMPDEEEDDEVSIVSSPDGRICLYRRNIQTRDASMGWSIIYDVKDDGMVYTYEGLPDWEGEPATLQRIYSLPHPRRHLYLFDAFFRISGSYGYQAFVAYELTGHELKRVAVLTDEQGDLSAETGFEYNFADYYFRFARALEYDYQYTWDEENGILYYPLLQEDSYQLNDRFIVYRWNGKTMKPTTDTVCNPRLYEPLRNYVSCLQHTKAGYAQVRVDSLPDGRLRYTAWDREQNVASKPNIILFGKREGDEYHFYNPPTYTYVVTIEDIPEVHVYYGDTIGQLDELANSYTEK
ncbi:MAG: hypothetical protein IJ814_07830 [Paludibacteraceae bacterium]|nr:hypothetical protein [Paludibacteraceae bacterium]